MATSSPTAPINYQSPLTGVLQDLLGRRTTGNSNTTTNNTNVANTAGNTSGSSTGSVTTTADLGPLMQAFGQASQGMSPEQLSTLISSIFQEGAQQVPSLIGAYANSTGSRATGNSGTRLALDELNRNLSTQAAQALLNYNQSSQQNAGNIAGRIAENTRQTTQQQQQQGTTNQQQTQVGTQTQNQTQRQNQSVNPGAASAVGLGGAALNLLDKSGVLKRFGIGGGTTGSGGGIGAISGGGGSLVPNATGTGITETMGGPAASYGSLAPASSSGFLTASAPPMGAPVAGGGGFLAPAGGGGGITAPMGGGGFTGGLGGSSYGGLGSNVGLDFGMGAGNLPNYFDIGGTGSLGNVGSEFFGNNPYGYTGDAGGITSIGGGNFGLGDGTVVTGAPSWITDAWDGVSSGIGDFLGGAADWVGSFFADGGDVGNRGFGAPGDSRYGGGSPGMMPRTPVPTGNIWNATRMRNEMAAGLMPPPQVMQVGNVPRIPAGMPTGVPVTAGGVAELLPFLARQMLGFADGGMIRRGGYADGGALAPGYVNPANSVNYVAPNPAEMFHREIMRYVPGGYADGGQVSTGGASTGITRNRNYSGAPMRRQQEQAINFEGYGPAPTAAVGASVPAGGGSGISAPAAAGAGGMGAGIQMMGAPVPTGGGPTSTARTISWDEYQAMENAAYQQREAQAAALRGAGGSGGVGEGGAPTASATDGVTTSGLSSAASVANAVAPAIGLPGIPGLSTLAAIVQAISNQIAQAAISQNQATMDALIGQVSGGGGPGNTDNDAVGAVGSVSGENPSDAPGVSSAADGIGAAADSGGPSSDGGGSSGGDGDGGSSGGDGDGGSWADGGLVRGRGTGTSDSIRVKSRQPGGPDINYSDGEFVIPTDVVNFYGKNMLQSMIDAVHTPVSR